MQAAVTSKACVSTHRRGMQVARAPSTLQHSHQLGWDHIFIPLRLILQVDEDFLVWHPFVLQLQPDPLTERTPSALPGGRLAGAGQGRVEQGGRHVRGAGEPGWSTDQCARAMPRRRAARARERGGRASSAEGPRFAN
eukprot:scaffold175396_cov31-Tisochrysis_lutea.AAC.3